MAARRAPRKFTDHTRTEITQEWLDWYAEASAEGAEEAKDGIALLGEPIQNRWPEDYGKDIGDGGWIIVVDEPVTELRQRFRIPTPSLWWARPERSRPGGMDWGTKTKPMPVPGPYRVVIETPGGSLWLFPHEYVVCTDPLPLITDPDCTIHPLGGQVAFDEDQQEQMFYLQSRGWSRQDAILALMEGLDMRDWGWVEFPEYARAAFEGVGALPRFARA